MDNKIIKITSEQVQNKSAEILKLKQDEKAAKLQSDQRYDAEDLLQEQIDSPEINRKDDQEKAAKALHQSQKAAALALKESQEDDAEILKNANARSAQEIKNRNQTIIHLSGGYTNTSEDED